jgi:hypothetical protein
MTKTLENVTDNFIPRSQLAKEPGERLRGKPFAEMTLIMWEKEGKGPPATRVGREVPAARLGKRPKPIRVTRGIRIRTGIRMQLQ